MTSRSAPIAYRALAEELRQAVKRGEYADGKPLPTEQELSLRFGVSRQTVRRAMQDLVAEGAVYRIPGKGTFPTANRDRYFRTVGSIEDLMALSEDTDATTFAPIGAEVDIGIAGRLRLDTDEVHRVELVRFHDDAPFCHTTVFLPPSIGSALSDDPFLSVVGAKSRATIIGMIESRTPHRFFAADQSVTTMPVPDGLADSIDLQPGDWALRIDRIYFDARGRGLELAMSYFNPSRYSYRITLRR